MKRNKVPKAVRKEHNLIITCNNNMYNVFKDAINEYNKTHEDKVIIKG